MKKVSMIIAGIATIFWGADALARDTLHQLPVASVLEEAGFASQIAGVKFYFGDSAHPAITKELGEYRTNKKTNAFNKSDVEACNWVFRSAILALHQRAVSLGANAVVNVRSNYKNNVTVSDTKFTCGAGGIMAGVALVGDFVVVE